MTSWNTPNGPGSGFSFPRSGKTRPEGHAAPPQAESDASGGARGARGAHGPLAQGVPRGSWEDFWCEKNQPK